ncbi:MAG: hypothetical protein ACK5O7_07225 [Holosporales bacterium]
MHNVTKKIIVVGLILCSLMAILVAVVTWRKGEIRHFRAFSTEVSQDRIKRNPQRAQSINRTGLDHHLISGSGYLNIQFIERYQANNQKPVVVVCLLAKKEPYIKNWHVFFYGLRSTQDGQIVQRESRDPWQHFQWAVRRLIDGVPQNDPQAWKAMAVAEQDALASKGIECKHFLYDETRLDATQRNYWITDWRWVDDYIALVESLPKDAAIHFHCEHGRGRTTVCMVMYDIFKNAKQVSLQDIVDRQWAIGGEDMFDTAARRGGTWTPEMLQKRKELITQFYAYVVDEKQGYGHTSFAQWQKNHPYKAK